MYKSGDIVLQEKTIVNCKNYKDNKKDRLSVVLFNFYYNETEYYCTCPITNHKITINKQNKNFLFIPYEILSDKKLCSIKLDTINHYKAIELKPTGLKLNQTIILKLFKAILKFDAYYIDKKHYEFIKNNINVLINDIEEKENKIKKEQKKLNKQLKKERKRNYKNINLN